MPAVAKQLGDNDSGGLLLLGDAGAGLLGPGYGSGLGARRAALSLTQRSLFARITATPTLPIFVAPSTNIEGGEGGGSSGGGEGTGDGGDSGGDNGESGGGVGA